MRRYLSRPNEVSFASASASTKEALVSDVGGDMMVLRSPKSFSMAKCLGLADAGSSDKEYV